MSEETSEEQRLKQIQLYIYGEMGKERISAETVDTIIQSLNENDDKVASTAAWVLSHLKLPQAVPHLILALKHKSGDVRKNAAMALGEMGASEAMEPLIEAASDIDYEVKASAIRALGKFSSKKAYDVVFSALDHEEPEVRSNCVIALGEMGAKQAIPDIETVATNPNEILEVRQCALAALGMLKSNSSLKLLEEILLSKETHGMLRVAAAHSLGNIGDKDALAALLLAQETFSNSNDTPDNYGNIRIIECKRAIGLITTSQDAGANA